MWRSYPQADFNKYIIDYNFYSDYYQCYIRSSSSYYPWYNYSLHNPFMLKNSWFFKPANKSVPFHFFLNH
jgi:hypothetical protein